MSIVVNGTQHVIEKDTPLIVQVDIPTDKDPIEVNGPAKAWTVKNLLEQYAKIKELDIGRLIIDGDIEGRLFDQPLNCLQIPLKIVVRPTTTTITTLAQLKNVSKFVVEDVTEVEMQAYNQLPGDFRVVFHVSVKKNKRYSHFGTNIFDHVAAQANTPTQILNVLRSIVNLYHKLKPLSIPIQKILLDGLAVVGDELRFTPNCISWGKNTPLADVFRDLFSQIVDHQPKIQKLVPWFDIASKNFTSPALIFDFQQYLEELQTHDYFANQTDAIELNDLFELADLHDISIDPIAPIAPIAAPKFDGSRVLPITSELEQRNKWMISILRIGYNVCKDVDQRYISIPEDARAKVFDQYDANTIAFVPINDLPHNIPMENMIYAARNLFIALSSAKMSPSSDLKLFMEGFTLRIDPSVEFDTDFNEANLANVIANLFEEPNRSLFNFFKYAPYVFESNGSSNLVDYKENPKEKARKVRNSYPRVNLSSNQDMLDEVNEDDIIPPEMTRKRGRGRPKGSKNKPRDSTNTNKRGPGRPPGKKVLKEFTEEEKQYFDETQKQIMNNLEKAKKELQDQLQRMAGNVIQTDHQSDNDEWKKYRINDEE
jgi:hypothetical protein